MHTPQPQPIRLQDYAVPDYLVEHIALHIDLDPAATTVRSILEIRRHPEAAAAPLILQGRELTLQSLALDGRPLAPGEYGCDEETLTIPGFPASGRLEVVTLIHPQENTSLEGLYISRGIFCTQCEAQGFRKITYFPDRPDVLTRFTTTLTAERGRFPVLLSNGNAVERGELDGGRHFVRWEDPFAKPCYLFALVAGDLARLTERYRARSGREVALEIYCEQRNLDKCDFAMHSLKEAMAWDEETFGLEYDLDTYMILAVDDFNMGAMENKGLNIFNAKYVLARPDTATDADYQAIEEVIGHEYFHNWTGNRVTCRDWFQLSLKEGLTVFRDQEFSADMTSRAVKRIADVRTLRSTQFPEDGGPMAHPVRPSSYLEINNFYTTTVYNKGAEVIRMVHTLLGPAAFRKGLRLYLERHDGRAATIEDFLAAMAEAGDRDLKQFARWYDQAGTPELLVTGSYDPARGSYTLHVRQRCPATPGQPDKKPFHVPLAVGLLDRHGNDLPLQLDGEAAPASETTRVLELLGNEEEFRFVGLTEPPIPSLLRGFSAPVKLEMERSDEELAFLFGSDRDPFNRWEAGQELATRLLLNLVKQVQADGPLKLPQLFVSACRKTLLDAEADRALLALALTLPAESYLAERLAVADPTAIHIARQFVRRGLAGELSRDWEEVFASIAESGPYAVTPEAVGRRSLKNLCLAYLMTLEEAAIRETCCAQYRRGANMTDTIAALACLVETDGSEREEALADFYKRWQDEPLVVDKWFALQAASGRAGTLGEVQRLLNHPAFTLKTPNRVRALIGTFAHGNPAAFHAADGSGYRFLADQILAVDRLNPQVAARLAGAFSRWRRFDPARQPLMRQELERFITTAGISRDVYEIASKSLA
jgi:aminopeptidase N